MKRKILGTTAAKLILIFSIMFLVSCLKLCAESMTPAETLVAREKFVEDAKKQVGKPYVYGAVGPDSFDCSGLVYYVARESVKVQLPRTAKAIYSYVRIVSDEEREVGDLIFFCTNSSETINHVGIYIGNNQFISAISDGENTGVIVSSLRQTYWRGKVRGTGQFLPSGKQKENLSEDFEEELVVPDGSTEETSPAQGSESEGAKESKNDEGKNTAKSNYHPIADNIIFDTTAAVDWTLISHRQFAFKYRGIDAKLAVSYADWELEPGLGLIFRYNHALGVFQMPLVISIALNDYIKLYAGPVFSFGTAKIPDSDEVISPAVFPGIAGVSFNTPSINIGKFGIQAVQDINYSVCNGQDGSALNFVDSFISGFALSTGLRVTFPLSTFF